jgi:hypothetical protein
VSASAAEAAIEARPEQSERLPESASAAAPSKASATAPQEASGETAAAGGEAATEAKVPEGSKPEAAATSEPAAAVTDTEAPASSPAPATEPPAKNVEVPHEPPRPTALDPSPDAEAVYTKVLDEQLAKGSSRQVAEARAKVAQAKAAKGIKRGPTPIEVEKPVPSAPPKGHTEPEPSGAPAATAPKGSEEMATATVTPDASTAPSTAPEVPPADEPAPLDIEPKPLPPDIGDEEEGALVDPGPSPDAGETTPDKVVEVVSTEEQSGDGRIAQAPAASTAQAPAAGGEDPQAIYDRVFAAEKAKGSSEAVATGRAKSAQRKAEKAGG